MQVVASSNNITPRLSPAEHTSDVGTGAVENEDIVRAPIDFVDKDMHGKTVSTTSLYQQRYNHKKVWLTISQVVGVTNSLLADSQKHDDELMEPLKLNKHQYGVGHITFADPDSERFRSIKVQDMPEQRGTNLFLKILFALAIDASRRRHSCV